MIALGNFFFRYRDGLFPCIFALMVLGIWLPLAGDRQVQGWMLAAGFAVSLLGQLIRALTIGLDYIRRGGKNRTVYAEKLVRTGIFAHCRNPLYLGNLLMIAGLGIMSNSLPFFLVGMPFFAIAYWAIILAEENFLRGKFGSEYVRYCAEVPRLIPRLAGLGGTIFGMRFNWQRLVVKEYQTLYIWGLGAAFFLLVFQCANRNLAIGSQPALIGTGTVMAVWTVLFLTAWILKKKKILRAK